MSVNKQEEWQAFLEWKSREPVYELLFKLRNDPQAEPQLQYAARLVLLDSGYTQEQVVQNG